jgi:hypothetical protein
MVMISTKLHVFEAQSHLMKVEMVITKVTGIDGPSNRRGESMLSDKAYMRKGSVKVNQGAYLIIFQKRVVHA